jgi:hypothetical protein
LLPLRKICGRSLEDGPCGDDRNAGFECQALATLCDVHRVAQRRKFQTFGVANRTREYIPIVDAHSHSHWRLATSNASLIPGRHPLLDPGGSRKRGNSGTRVRFGHAEHGHHSVANEFVDNATCLLNGFTLELPNLSQ